MLIYCWLSTGLVVFSPTLFAYFDPQLNFSLFSVFFWTSIHFVWFWDYLSIVIGGTLILLTSSLYIRYQFMQINCQIKECIRRGDTRGLRRALLSHNIVTRHVKKMNGNVRYFNYIFFTVAKPANNLLLYISCEPDTHPLVVIVLRTMFAVNYLVMFFITSMGALVIGKAHDPITTLNSYIASSSIRSIRFRDKLKIVAVIERLAGPKIGFYCLDLYPITYRNLLDYVLDSMTSYVLLIRLIKRINIS